MMDNIREKLVELLTGCGICFHCWPSGIHEEQEKRRIADHLLANGVTVQRWIPVSEPPKEYRDEYGELIPFLVCVEGTDYPFRAMYDGKTWGDGIFAIHVKWWMPLPQPPKGE